MVKDQQIRTLPQHNVAFEGTLRGINVGKGCPARAGGRAQGNGDAGQRKTVGQQLAGIQHFPPACRQHGVTAVSVVLQTSQIQLAAIELKLSIRRCKTNGFKISCQVLA